MDTVNENESASANREGGQNGTLVEAETVASTTARKRETGREPTRRYRMMSVHEFSRARATRMMMMTTARRISNRKSCCLARGRRRSRLVKRVFTR